MKENMTKEELVSLLNDKIPSTSKYQLPRDISVRKQGTTIIMSLSRRNMTSNMQTDVGAFDAWAMILKGFLRFSCLENPQCSVVKIRIDGRRPENMTKQELGHYNRFIYRLSKFVDSNEWAYAPDFENEIKIFRKKNNELVINVPQDEAQLKADKKEAKLERAYCTLFQDRYEAAGQQLPVRLFQKEIKESNAITASGFIDLWSLTQNKLTVYELKTKENRKVGILSELLFYVYVMQDVMTHKIGIPHTSKFRAFDAIYKAYESKNYYVEGVLLAPKLHPLLCYALDLMQFQKLNGVNVHFKSSGEDVKIYTGIPLLRPDLGFDDELVHQLIKLEEPIFEHAKAGGIWRIQNVKGKIVKVVENKPYILKPENSVLNLAPFIRVTVQNYFKENGITWWREQEDGYTPPGHILSSQVNCVNHLFALRNDLEALKIIVENATDLKVEKILRSPLDKDGYLTFEFTCENKRLLKERGSTRGSNCTSIDALLYVLTKDGKKVLVPIEWKYTEHYSERRIVTKKNDFHSVIEQKMNTRYLPLITASSNIKYPTKDYVDLFVEPYYEFMRQTLLVEQIIANKGKEGITIEADDYRHLIICPKNNKSTTENMWAFKRGALKDDSKLQCLTPQQLLEPLESNKQYNFIFDYLKQRYWE